MSTKIVTFFLALFVFCKTSYSQTSPSTTPSYQLSGNALLLSNLVRDGVSQSNNDPALVAAFLFNFGPQFNIGLKGSNVSYNTSTAHLNLQLGGQLKIDFSSTSNFMLEYNLDQYYSDSSRNGSILKMNVVMLSKYKVIISMFSNWEGTATSASNYAFGYSQNVFGGWAWDNIIGYTMVQATGYSNYFNFKSEISYKIKPLVVGAGIEGTSASSQFQRLGDIGFIFFIGANF